MEYDVIVKADGKVEFIYADDLAEVFEGEDLRTRRVSHVEPATAFGWECEGWLADMRPTKGPLLYASVDARGVKQAFKTRQAALDAEREWLRREKGL